MSFDSHFDHFIAGDKNAIDASARRGWDLFNTKAPVQRPSPRSTIWSPSWHR